MNRLITPACVHQLELHEVFVFGSNEAGIHGAGAARQAHNHFGAKAGQGFGKAGRTFAIPTKDWQIETLPLPAIGFYVSRFLEFARHNKPLTFLVTPIGCGLAGYKPHQIAPMFRDAPMNVALPNEFVHQPEFNLK